MKRTFIGYILKRESINNMMEWGNTGCLQFKENGEFCAVKSKKQLSDLMEMDCGVTQKVKITIETI